MFAYTFHRLSYKISVAARVFVKSQRSLMASNKLIVKLVVALTLWLQLTTGNNCYTIRLQLYDCQKTRIYNKIIIEFYA